jgi:hypothetical protein
MRTPNALVLLTLVWAGPSAADTMPARCDELVIPASATPRETAALVRGCTDALRAEPRQPSRTAEPVRAEPAKAVRQFAALRELGELRLRSGPFPAASLQQTAEEPAEPEPAHCALATPGSASVPSTTCAGCHPRHGHPVDVDYASSHARAPFGLRTEAEVVRRGVLLPEGRVECVTCHDGHSPWKDRIALPPGAPVLPAVVAGRPETYPRGNWRLARASSQPRLPPGSAVTPAPLCAACHTMAD